jgi:hypothetical protein
MAMGSPEWIEESLARLESMEQARDEHETALEATTDAEALRMHSESIDRLDEEIKQLYAALEAVAEEGDDDEEDDEVDEVIRTSPFGRGAEASEPGPAPAVVSAPAPAAALDDLPDDPFGAPAPAPVAASAAPAASPAFADPAPMAMDMGFDEPKSGGAGMWIVLVVLLAGGGVGGFMFWKNNQKPPPAPVAPVEQRVIEATAVPDDTQGPKGAQGREGVTRTPERELGKSGGGRRGGGGGRSSSAGSSGKKSNGKAIELKSGDDPLG